MFWHEVGHVVQGHTDYNHEVYGRALLPEGEKRQTIPPRTAQVLELMADYTAIYWTIVTWLTASASKAELDRLMLSDESEAVRVKIFAIGVLFMVVGQSRLRVRDYKKPRGTLIECFAHRSGFH